MTIEQFAAKHKFRLIDDCIPCYDDSVIIEQSRKNKARLGVGPFRYPGGESAMKRRQRTLTRRGFIVRDRYPTDLALKGEEPCSFTGPAGGSNYAIEFDPKNRQQVAYVFRLAKPRYMPGAKIPGLCMLCACRIHAPPDAEAFCSEQCERFAARIDRRCEYAPEIRRAAEIEIAGPCRRCRGMYEAKRGVGDGFCSARCEGLGPKGTITTAQREKARENPLWDSMREWLLGCREKSGRDGQEKAKTAAETPCATTTRKSLAREPYSEPVQPQNGGISGEVCVECGASFFSARGSPFCSPKCRQRRAKHEKLMAADERYRNLAGSGLAGRRRKKAAR